MSRPLRINYENAWYHVMHRGAGKQNIFNTDDHRRMFLDILQESSEMFNVEIHAYCLMSNHYHLLVKTPDANLSRAMKHINGVYTQSYNRSMKKDGALFRGRFKAKLIEDDCYQLMVSRYIHLNPVEAKMVQKAEQYNWSSYQFYLGLNQPPKWLSTDVILLQVNTRSGLLHIANYQEYVERADVSDINTFYSLKYTAPIIGSELFREKILSTIGTVNDDGIKPDIKRTKSTPDLHFIASQLCQFYQVNYSVIQQSRRHLENWPRNLFIYICRRKYGYSLKSIAEYLGNISPITVAAAVQRCSVGLQKCMHRNEEMFSICNEIKRNLLNENI